MIDAILSPAEARALLRESAIVVRPGETLIIRVPMDVTPAQVHEYYACVRQRLNEMGSPFTALVLPAEELGVFGVAVSGDD